MPGRLRRSDRRDRRRRAQDPLFRDGPTALRRDLSWWATQQRRRKRSATGTCERSRSSTACRSRSSMTIYGRLPRKAIFWCRRRGMHESIRPVAGAIVPLALMGVAASRLITPSGLEGLVIHQAWKLRSLPTSHQFHLASNAAFLA